MKILVTGGAGFIGSHLVDLLINSNHQVSVIDDLSTGNKTNINPDCKFYKETISSKNIVKIFKHEKPSLVIHLAAQTSHGESIKNPYMDAKTNILGTINLLEVCKKNSVRKIIYASVDNNLKTTPHNISKMTGDEYLKLYSELYNIHYSIYEFNEIIGTRDNVKSLINTYISDVIEGKECGDCRIICPVTIKNAVKRIVDGFDSLNNEKYYIAGNGDFSSNEIYEILLKIKNNEEIHSDNENYNSICLSLKESFYYFKNHFLKT